MKVLVNNFLKQFKTKDRIQIISIILSLLFIGNAVNNFFRYTDIYKFIYPSWIKHYTYSLDQNYFSNKWGMEDMGLKRKK